LAETALGVEPEVEEEDGGFDEPDPEREDVFCGEVVLFGQMLQEAMTIEGWVPV
jgi:hypothetical protein